ncbi:MAG: FRG domain-containing protein [Sedimentisphaerales bacterium]|nr:FRG domain-containing protein [Sedimentisphaerales bacterium]
MRVTKGKINLKFEEIKSVKDVFVRFKEFHEQSKNFKRVWIFRGQKSFVDDSKGLYKLSTTLERSILDYGKDPKMATKIEMGLFRRFKRQSEVLLRQFPQPGNYMEWFALMQNYGAPTRLLDWTYSFFVGLYFAVEDMSHHTDCELWAIDLKYLTKTIRRIFPRKTDRRCAEDDPNAQVYKNFEYMFVRNPKRYVCPMNPYKFNDRLIIQQGVSLCPGDITKPFAENLGSHFSKQVDLDNNLKVLKINKSNEELRKEILQILYRMNISKATLFPGLDGFAKSLRELFVFPKVTDMFPAETTYVKKHTW